MFCKKCGKKLLKNSNFCSDCGITTSNFDREVSAKKPLKIRGIIKGLLITLVIILALAFRGITQEIKSQLRTSRIKQEIESYKESPSVATESSSLESELSDVAEKTNKTLPKMIDEITELTRVTISGNNLVYDYRITDSETKFAQNDIELYLKKDVTASVCENPSTKNLLDMGCGFIFNYHDINNNFIGKVSVDSNNCIK